MEQAWYTIENLLADLKDNQKSYDLEQVKKAYDLAEHAHDGQVRKSGEPYIIHPVAVARILVTLGMDVESIMAALLHDVVEDTAITLEEVKKTFGADVAGLVDGVTKLGRLPFSSREQQQAENIRKMLIAMAKDVRVIIIKLADRLHNMRTIDFIPEQKRRDKALETMEVYAPIAHRLGIRTIKEELEDICIRYLDPVAYKEIDAMLDLKKEERNRFLKNIMEKIRLRLENEYGHVYVDGRVKSIYGIYRKVYIQGRAFDEIFDIYAVRIIVDSVLECYNILGEIHDMFRPLPNRFKDYISTPKPNMYQSLHTTVIDKEAIPFEIQIRTWDMHHTAEFGIAAHWKYKEGLSGKDKLEERIAWVRQILESQKDSGDAQEILSSIKSDLAPEEVFVFTPKGDVISLPVGATVIDFAYAIHSAVGNRMIGAKVDGRMVSIDTVVKTGMVVEIVTTNAAGHGPSRDWLKIVRTTGARNRIRSWFKKERREENIQEGRSELNREFKRNLITLTDSQHNEFIAELARKNHQNSVDDFYAAIGYGGISLSRLMPRIKEEYTKRYRADERSKPKIVEKTRPGKSSSGVIVEGLDTVLIKFSKCCNPLPGDEIIGYVTRGFGVSVHKTDCINVLNAQKDVSQRERWVACEWAESSGKETFKSTVGILATNRSGIIMDVSVALNNMRVPIYSLNAKEAKNGGTDIQITLGIGSLEQLKAIVANLEKIDGILQIERSVQ